ncbi:hypothetical protein Pfo_013887 [Paulownia fortunei]|nr:hypothetical protein Pfo_013887 [Paulownia fortunei]
MLHILPFPLPFLFLPSLSSLFFPLHLSSLLWPPSLLFPPFPTSLSVGQPFCPTACAHLSLSFSFLLLALSSLFPYLAPPPSSLTFSIAILKNRIKVMPEKGKKMRQRK